MRTDGKGLHGAFGLAAGCLALALFAGCGDDGGGGGDPGPPTVICDVDLTPTDFSFDTMGQYDPAAPGTTIMGTDSGGDFVAIMFPGTGTGTFTSGAMLAYDHSGLPYVASDFHGNTDYTINVTAYGPVGGRIEGTFSGVLCLGLDPLGLPVFSITNGYFNVIREPDL